MKISDLINNLSNVLKQHGDLPVIMGDPQRRSRAYDIDPLGCFVHSGDEKRLVLSPHAEAVAKSNSAILADLGGSNG